MEDSQWAFTFQTADLHFLLIYPTDLCCNSLHINKENNKRAPSLPYTANKKLNQTHQFSVSYFHTFLLFLHKRSLKEKDVQWCTNIEQQCDSKFLTYPGGLSNVQSKTNPKTPTPPGKETIMFTDLGTLKSPAGRYWKVTYHSQCRLLQFSKCTFLNWPLRFSFSSLICTVSNLPWIHWTHSIFLTIILPLQYITSICIFKSSKSTECLYCLMKVHFIMLSCLMVLPFGGQFLHQVRVKWETVPSCWSGIDIGSDPVWPLKNSTVNARH